MSLSRSIRAKFIVILFPVFLSGVIGIVYSSYRNSVRHFEKLGREGLRYAVTMAYILCREQDKNVKNGSLSVAEAQENVRTALTGPLASNGKRDLSEVKIKIGKEDYFFAVDSNGITQMHPKLPVGTDVSRIPFIRKFIRMKNGIVHYKWKNKGEKFERDKMAVITYYEPWDWIIGIGAYMDNFTRPAKDHLQKSFVYIGLFSALFLASLIAVIFSITMPLKKLKEGVLSLSWDNPEPLQNIKSQDEVGALSDAMNRMIVGLRERNFIKETFGKYVSKQVQEAILSNQIPLNGERKKVTIMFIDIRNFTSLAETLSPEDLIVFLNEYFTSMVDAIVGQGGTVDKYIGDAIMAVFGAPISDENDSLNAIRAAELLMGKLAAFNKSRLAHGMESINIGIGLHTGEVVAGNVGSRQRMEYTVLGDNVNLASRIESLTKRYKTPVIISDSIYRELMGMESIKMREIDSVRVKGRKKPVVLYEFYGFLSAEQIALVDRTIADFMSGITAYKIQSWREASNYFHEVLKKNPEDHIAKMYIKRCEFLIDHPVPKNWDGVFDFS